MWASAQRSGMLVWGKDEDSAFSLPGFKFGFYELVSGCLWTSKSIFSGLSFLFCKVEINNINDLIGYCEG